MRKAVIYKELRTQFHLNPFHANITMHFVMTYTHYITSWLTEKDENDKLSSFWCEGRHYTIAVMVGVVHLANDFIILNLSM